MPSVSNLGLKTPRCARSAESLGPGGKKKISFEVFDPDFGGVSTNYKRYKLTML